MNPGFLKPFHFVTLGLAVKQSGISLLELPQELVTYAARMKLWQSIGMLPPCQVNERSPDGRFLPIHRFQDNDRNVQQISKALAKIVIKTTSEDYQESLTICLAELVNNFFDHAKSNVLPCLVSAQGWPNGNLIQLAIADAGMGIRNSLEESSDNVLMSKLRKENACKLASEYWVSSKLGNNHSGYGLTLAKDMMQQNGGTYLLLSGNEIFCCSNGREIFTKIPGSWQGTLLVLEWKMDKQLDSKRVYESWPMAVGLNEDDFSKLKLVDMLQGEASRKRARDVRQHIILLLEKDEKIEIDLQDVSFTPSVADEIIGELAALLGAVAFKQKIKILNASESQMALMRHVIARKLSPQSKAS